MATIATLAVRLIGDVSDLKSKLGEAQSAIKSVGTNLSNAGKGLSLAVTAPILGIAGAAIKAAADQEQLEVSFTTMLGSAERAKTLLGELSAFSASTPFQLPEVNNAAKQLLAFGFSAEEIKPALTSLGDISAGLNIPLGEMAYLFGTSRAQGRLFTADINQFSSRGVPIIAALAKTMGVAESEVRGLVESGKVGFPELQAALGSLTAEGGQFSGLMEAQSQTMAGLFSTLQDNIGLALTAIGTKIVETFDLKTKVAGALEWLSRAKDALLAFADANPALFRLILIFTAIAAAIGPLLIGIGWLAGAFAAAMPAIIAIGGAFALIVSPIGLVVAALAALWAMDFGGFRTRISAFVGNFIQNIGLLPVIAKDVFDAISWIWAGPKQAANIDWWGDITSNIEKLLGLDFGTLDGWAEKLYNFGVVAGNVKEIIKNLTSGGKDLAQGIADAVAAIGGVTGATVDVTAGVTSVSWGSFTYQYDATSGITRVDWTWPGLGTFKYDATSGIVSIDWTGSLGAGTRQAFSYDSQAGIKLVKWNEELFDFTYDAAAAITTVDFGQGFFKGTYSAIANITSVGWGVYQHFYSAEATITRVAWGAYEHLYNASAGITEDNVLWGAWSNTYDAKAQVAESSILWGAGTFTYDVSAAVSEGNVLWGTYQHFYSASADIVNVAWGAYQHLYDAEAGIKQDSVLWGAWSNTYDVLAQVAEGSVLWGLWTWEYSATAGVENVTFAGGLGKKIGDWFKSAIESGAIATANITTPDWITSLLAWDWPAMPSVPDWLNSLLAWDWPGFPSAPGWVSNLVGWDWPGFPGAPEWLSDLLDWQWPGLPALPSWLGGSSESATNALGTSYWAGGATRVGELGPETVILPRGSQIINDRQLAGASAGWGGPIAETIIVQGEEDLYRLAYLVSDIQQRRRGGRR